MKILIAEDDKTSRMILEDILDRWGHEVVSTANGDEALAALQSPDAPRLAILDWVMPGMDGLEVCKRLREVETRLPTYIIFLTVLDRKKDIVVGLEAGADDYVTKPFDENELRARINAGRRIVDLQASLANRVEEVEEALSHIKVLQGILPICMHCRRIRTDEKSWQGLENYIQEHSDAEFSHGLCPDCQDKYYKDWSGSESDKTEQPT